MPLFTSRGMYFPFEKEPAAGRPICELESLSRVYVPLKGPAFEATVLLRDYSSVLVGQPLAETDSGVTIPAPVSGVLAGRQTLNHPVWGETPCLALDSMEFRRAVPEREQSVENLPADRIVELARQYGVMDELDGRPLYDKLIREKGRCAVLVGDAVEDQPYGSAAWEVLNESAEQIYSGLQLAARALGDVPGHLTVQPLPGNHRRALQQRLGDTRGDRLFVTARRYPVTVYTKKAPADKVCRIGVQALRALFRAAAFHEAHTGGVVTVAGNAVSTPRNLLVPFGTPAVELLKRCGLSADPNLLIFGDALTGRAVTDPNTPLWPGVTCLLATVQPERIPADVCTGCGQCLSVCHAGLSPAALWKRLEQGATDLSFWHPEDCDGCGACAAVCPAGLELTRRFLAYQKEGSLND